MSSLQLNLPKELFQMILTLVPVNSIDWDHARDQNPLLDQLLPRPTTWARLICMQQSPVMFSFLREQAHSWDATAVVNIVAREQYLIDRTITAIEARLQLKEAAWKISQDLLRHGVTILTYIQVKASALSSALMSRRFALKLLGCLPIRAIIALRYTSLVICYAWSVKDDHWLPGNSISDYQQISNHLNYPSKQNTGRLVLAMESVLTQQFSVDQLPDLLEKGLLRHHWFGVQLREQVAAIQQVPNLVEILDKHAATDYTAMEYEELCFAGSLAIERRIVQLRWRAEVKAQIRMTENDRVKNGDDAVTILAYLNNQHNVNYLLNSSKAEPAKTTAWIRGTAQEFIPERYIEDFDDAFLDSASARCAIRRLKNGDKTVLKCSEMPQYIKSEARRGRISLSVNVP